MKIERIGVGVRKVVLPSRVNVNNASALERELYELSQDMDVSEIVLDASRLNYISSAGIRAILPLIKTPGKTMGIVGVSRDVYEVFSETGIAGIVDVECEDPS